LNKTPGAGVRGCHVARGNSVTSHRVLSSAIGMLKSRRRPRGRRSAAPPRRTRLQRVFAGLGAALMVVGGLSGLSTLGTSPASAATPGPASSTHFGVNAFQAGKQTLFAYVGQ